MKKLLALLMATAMTALAFTGCGNGEGQKADENAVNIGVLAPTTGGVAVYGQACYNSFMLAAEERNAEGGVHGKQINLVHQDEEGDITKAVNAYNKLAGDGVCAILGDITSKPTIAVAKTIAQSAKPLPMMTPTATAAPVTTFGDTVYKACFNDPYQGEVMANYAKVQQEGAVGLAAAGIDEFVLGRGRVQLIQALVKGQRRAEFRKALTARSVLFSLGLTAHDIHTKKAGAKYERDVKNGHGELLFRAAALRVGAACATIILCQCRSLRQSDYNTKAGR